MADGSIPKTSNTLGNWKHSGLDHKVPMQCETTQDPPSFLAVVTGTEYAYTREDGVHVVPLGCLRD